MTRTRNDDSVISGSAARSFRHGSPRDEIRHQPPLRRLEKVAQRLMEHAHAFDPIQDGRIYIEKLNGPFLFGDKGTPTKYAAGLDCAISRGWLVMHESGTYVKFTQAGADLFA